MTAKRRKKKEFVLPIEKINDLIAAIFQAKQKSDLWATKSEFGSFIRFDRFVLRYFMLQVGMLGVARRHLRLFVRSAVKHLHMSSNGREELPRIYLFCCLTGLESPSPNTEYNPRLSAEYFQPALRSLFPNPMTIEAGFLVRKSKQDATYPAVATTELEKACVPLTLQKVVGGKVAIDHYRRDLGPYTAKGLCNIDLGLAFALSLWVFMDAMRGMRERAALRTLQQCFRRKKYAKATNEAEVAGEAAKDESNEVAKDVSETGTSPPSEATKQESVADNYSPDEAAKEESDAICFPPLGSTNEDPAAPADEAIIEDNEANADSPNVEVPPLSRLTEQLYEARNLDAQLNSQGFLAEAT